MITKFNRAFRNSGRLLAKKDYYKILGLTQTASDSDIKKAYFNLAKKYHPDVNKSPDAKEKFAEINSAYETLGDPQKRKSYDATGMTGEEQDQYRSQGFGPFDFGFNPFGGFSSGGFPSGGFSSGGFSSGGFPNFQDIFSEFEDLFGMGRKEQKSFKGEDISLSVEIPFADAVHGASKEVLVQKKTKCSTCNGNRVRPGTSPVKCTDCGGRGKIFFERGPMSIQAQCQRCEGTGTIIKEYCSKCRGSGFESSKVKENVKIPAGVDTGQTLRMANKGHVSDGRGPPGDLFLKIKVKEDPLFKREGYDIVSEVSLSISQAALGGTVSVETLYGRVKLLVEPGTNSGDSKKLEKYGITHLPPNQHLRGNHIVKFKVVIPKHLSPRQLEIFKILQEEEKKGMA